MSAACLTAVRRRRRPTTSRALVAGFVGLCFVALGSPAMARGSARPPSSTWVAIIETERAVPAHWPGRLRTAAAKAPGTRAWVPPPVLSVPELVLALGCTGWTPACVGQAAEAAGAGRALVLALSSNGTGVRIGAAVVDHAGSAVVPEVTLVLPGTGAPDLQVAEAWLASIVATGRPAALLVTSDLDGDAVFVDGKAVGRTPCVVGDVALGQHHVQVRRAGQAPAQRTADVVVGTVTRVHVSLTSSPAPAVAPAFDVGAPPPPSSLPPTTTGWAVAAVGGALTLIGGGMAVAWGYPAAEVAANQDPRTGRLRVDYDSWTGPDPVGDERVPYLRRLFRLADDAPLEDPAVFAGVLDDARTLGSTGLVLLVAGVAVGVTGLAMALVPADPEGPPPPTAATTTTTATTTPPTTTTTERAAPSTDRSGPAPTTTTEPAAEPPVTTPEATPPATP